MKTNITLLFLFVAVLGMQSQYKYESSKIETIRWSPNPSYVEGIEQTEIDLNQNWKFAISDSLNMADLDQLNFSSISVPGEWVMQGFDVEKDEFGVYRKIFKVPSDWEEKSIKLRFEAVYSECEIWLNDQKIGAHFTGFTAFEIDITKNVFHDTKNELVVYINGSSTADKLSSASKYAVHNLGGISRNVSIIVLPKLQMASFHATTTFDKDYKNATLKIETLLSNKTMNISNIQMVYHLKNSDGKRIKSYKENNFELQPNASGKVVSEIVIEESIQWNPEKPYLYTLEAELSQGDTILEKSSKRIGFKQTEIRGNKVYVNNQPIKLRGVNRHEVHPKTGRVLRGDKWYNDVKIFKEGNVNYIRTSHYPPSEKLIESCDELGMFVEVEAPFCWASKSHINDNNYFDQILRPTLEMVEMLKSHPSILYWSLANESHDYKELFDESGRLVKIADPSRPRIFSQWGPDADNDSLEITNHHYPGNLEQVEKYKNYKRPIVFDEYIHLNAYNRKELATDPGLRDYWGLLFKDMWEKMYATDAVLGGAIWAGIDDSFFLPSGIAVGYGTWGPIDGWRREKPEFWHMKKAYSTVKIELKEIVESGIEISIENRNIFTNINEYKISWETDNENGIIKTDIDPLSKGSITVKLNQSSKSGVNIKVYSIDDGYLMDSYHFDLESDPEIIVSVKKNKIKTIQKDNEILISDSNFKYLINRTTGNFSIKNSNNKEIINGFPKALLIPITGEGGGIQMTENTPDFPIFSDTCSNRIIRGISINSEDYKVVVEIKESYAEISGSQTWTIYPKGKVAVEYLYKVMKDVNPRQIGIVFNLPGSFNQLDWKRNGLWSVYPDNHIGRLIGSSRIDSTVKISGLAGPSEEPDKEWMFDRTESGSNDFRSTKRNIYKVSMSDDYGSKFTVQSDGRHNSRAWKSKGATNILIAEYDNPGGERFLRSHGKSLDKNLKRGDKIHDKFTIELK